METKNIWQKPVCIHDKNSQLTDTERTFLHMLRASEKNSQLHT